MKTMVAIEKRMIIGVAYAMTLGIFAMPAAQAAVSEKEFAELKAMVQREKDAREIHNLMSTRSNLLGLGRNAAWIELFAKKQPDVSWYMNGRYRVGLETLRSQFVGDGSREKRNIEAMRKVYPDIEDKPENSYVGDLRLHAILSPIIVVADDGKTAKGFWQSIGLQIAVSSGKPNATLGFEKYAVDFIKEDGEWRFWHMATYTEYYYQLGKTLDQLVPPPGSTKPATTLRPGQSADVVDLYPEWSPWRVPAQVPLPVPYKTFSETFSYGPPAGTK